MRRNSESIIHKRLKEDKNKNNNGKQLQWSIAAIELKTYNQPLLDNLEDLIFRICTVCHNIRLT